MSELLSTKNLGNRIIIVVFISLLLLIIYFSYTSYRNNVSDAEKYVLEKLDGIATTLALEINGDVHQSLARKYIEKDAITNSDSVPPYHRLHELLRKAKEKNGLDSDIYTLVPSETGFQFIITSSAQPYFRHAYQQFPKQLEDDFHEGGVIGQYKSENGIWLSAFAPIKNDAGKTVAVVEVDQRFEKFIKKAKSDLLVDVGISLLVFLIVGGVLIYYLRIITRIDQEDKQKLQHSYAVIEQKNKNISESINYAKRIQDALITDEDVIKRKFPDSFIFFQGKDVVSGDFPWMYKRSDNDGSLYLASVDCTGHGVPGALLSIIGNFLLNDIIKNNPGISPGDILKKLHEGVLSALNPSHDGNVNDGMDIALVKFKENGREMEFAGAHRPLYLVKDNDLTEVKGTRMPIGSVHYLKRKKRIEYENHVITIGTGDQIYIFSDGLPDQFGGPDNRKFSNKRIRKIIDENKNRKMEEIGQLFRDSYQQWKEDGKQLDDILMIGIRFNN